MKSTVFSLSLLVSVYWPEIFCVKVVVLSAGSQEITETDEVSQDVTHYNIVPTEVPPVDSMDSTNHINTSMEAVDGSVNNTENGNTISTNLLPTDGDNSTNGENAQNTVGSPHSSQDVTQRGVNILPALTNLKDPLVLSASKKEHHIREQL